jgi:hypothetical protein
MPQATPSLHPLNPVRLSFISSLASRPPHLMGFFPLCRIGNPLCVLGSVTVNGRPLFTHTMWRCVARTRLFKAGRRSPILSGHERALLARHYHAPEACLISSPSRPPL